MGKQGPCYHCGVTSTPLWRNGPPEKPVLCNACGSRWRTKGSLANYTPLHARAEPGHREDHRIIKIKNITINKKKDVKVLKRKQNHEDVIGEDALDYVQGDLKVLDDDMSNRSSSGSAISNSESCAQFVSADASDFTGQAQSVVWETLVPSKKRTCVSRSKPSAVEKLTKDLCTILHEQQSSCFSGTSEEDLLFESEAPMVSVEIGHGSILIRHPSSKYGEEESEASSLSVSNKQYHSNEAYSCSPAIPVHSGERALQLPTFTSDRLKDRGMQVEQLRRDKSQKGKLEELDRRDSPLSVIDLKDVVNFEEFIEEFTSEEQKQLCTYLPDVDTAKFPDSLKSMFDSHQFEEDLSSFQQLLAEGVFDISLFGVKTEDCKTLKRLALSNLTKSTWVQRYCTLKKCKNSFKGYIVTRSPDITAADSSINMKRPRDRKNHKFSGEMTMMMSPKRVLIKSTDDNKENMESDGSCISPRSLFVVPPDDIQTMQFDEESFDQDLLLEVPSNCSFPQAELLHPNKTFGQQASTSSSSMYLHSFRPCKE